MDGFSLARRASAEFVGTAFLTLAIIGSGIAASRLSQGDQGFTLVANAIATGLVLVAIILALGSVSGGHLNPAVTVVAWMTGALSRSGAGVYALAQLGGAIFGALVVNLMFGLAAIDVSNMRVQAGSSGYPKSSRRSGWSWWSSGSCDPGDPRRCHSR
jgi:glycerol uptake facilitator-like aquaporin